MPSAADRTSASKLNRSWTSSAPLSTGHIRSSAILTSGTRRIFGRDLAVPVAVVGRGGTERAAVLGREEVDDLAHDVRALLVVRAAPTLAPAR